MMEFINEFHDHPAGGGLPILSRHSPRIYGSRFVSAPREWNVSPFITVNLHHQRLICTGSGSFSALFTLRRDMAMKRRGISQEVRINRIQRDDSAWRQNRCELPGIGDKRFRRLVLPITLVVEFLAVGQKPQMRPARSVSSKPL
jgi:hypothetical protein